MKPINASNANANENHYGLNANANDSHYRGKAEGGAPKTRGHISGETMTCIKLLFLQ